MSAEGGIGEDSSDHGLRTELARLRGDPDQPADVSVVVPVNAANDLPRALQLLADLAEYRGRHRVEIVLVINNYPADNPPAEIERFRRMGVRVKAIPDARRAGEFIVMSARAEGTRAAQADATIHFDADCKIADVNALIDWYTGVLHQGAGLAYTRTEYYELENAISVKIRIALHYLARWIKRKVLNIPTARGSNFAVSRDLFLRLYDAGQLSVELQLGPAAKLAGAGIAYSRKPELRVFTSGRRFHRGWRKIVRYFAYRLDYNLHAIPTRRHPVLRTTWDGFDLETQRRLDAAQYL